MTNKEQTAEERVKAVYPDARFCPSYLDKGMIISGTHGNYTYIGDDRGEANEAAAWIKAASRLPPAPIAGDAETKKEYQGTNYIADREQAPEWVCFDNGRTVGIAYPPDAHPYLVIDWLKDGEKWLRQAAAAESDAGNINIGSPMASDPCACDCVHCSDGNHRLCCRANQCAAPTEKAIPAESQPLPSPTERELIIGMKRALNLMENCDGDLDFAIFATKKDIAKLEAEATQ